MLLHGGGGSSSGSSGGEEWCTPAAFQRRLRAKDVEKKKIPADACAHCYSSHTDSALVVIIIIIAAMRVQCIGNQA